MSRSTAVGSDRNRAGLCDSPPTRRRSIALSRRAGEGQGEGTPFLAEELPNIG
jgi:hypothetical protein